jgi:Zn-dependent membrane protease YugP
VVPRLAWRLDDRVATNCPWGVEGTSDCVTQAAGGAASDDLEAVGTDGAEAARALLDEHGLQRVRVEIIPGFLTDHYDGQAKALRLSEPVGRERSVAALGVAGHEVSHAYQDAEGNRTYRARRSIGEQLAQFAPWSTFLLIAGFWLGVPLFIMLSLVFVGGLVLFALATLPVEIGASHRALGLPRQTGSPMLPSSAISGAS